MMEKTLPSYADHGRNVVQGGSVEALLREKALSGHDDGIFGRRLDHCRIVVR